MDRRRICLRDGADAVIAMIDISDIDNADAQISMAITVETRCDMGDWHENMRVVTVPWGKRLIEKSPKFRG